MDFHTSPEFRRELHKLPFASAQKFLVDLKKVNYIDSSGLATFIELFQKIRRGAGELVLFNLNDAVRSVFEIAKLDTIFRLVPGETEALALVG